MPGSSRTTSGSDEAAGAPAWTDPTVTEAEAAALLAVARAAVRAAVTGGATTTGAADLPPGLQRPAGAFVTLHLGRALRGCIGRVAADLPLGVAVAETAAGAATRDPRFLPVTADDLPQLELEISVLSPAVPITAEAVDPARHGLCLIAGRHRAVLLPQVARREGWGCDRLLAELSTKAGLPPDGWRGPEAVLLAFTVQTVVGPLLG